MLTDQDLLYLIFESKDALAIYDSRVFRLSKAVIFLNAITVRTMVTRHPD